MVSSVIARIIVVMIGTLYPGYRSYKGLIKADLAEVVYWTRYWIVFSIFIAFETVGDIFLTWFPFYYWIKIAFVIWMISPSGLKILYKRLVRPTLKEREQEIDKLIDQAKEQGYLVLATLANKGVRYASNLFLNTAAFGHEYLETHLKRSQSVNDIDHQKPKASPNRPLTVEEEDEELDPQFARISKEEIEEMPKTKVERKHRRTNSQKSANTNPPASYKVLPDLPTSPSTQKTSKKTSTPYSSSESSHYGTISRRSTSTNSETLKTNNAKTKKPGKELRTASAENLSETNED